MNTRGQARVGSLLPRLGWAALLLPAVLVGAPARAGVPQIDLDGMLDMPLEELLEVRVVSVLKQQHSLAEVPATVRIITSDEIRERGYFTLEEALADLPGFQFRNIIGFNSYVFLRGLPSQNNKLLVLVDGVQVNELNSGGFYGGGQFNLAAVERIEVLYGPASALYGTNAISGIVNLITRDPTARSGGEVTFLVGRFATGAADFYYRIRSPDGRRGVFVSGMLKTSDKADLKGRRGDFNWTESVDTFERDAALDLRWRAGGFAAGVLLQDKEASAATRQQTAGTRLHDHGVNWHIRFANAWASYRLHREGWSARATAYLRDTTVLDDTIPVVEKASPDSPGRQLRYYRPGKLAGSETTFHWAPATRWDVQAGLVLEREELATTFSITESASEDERPPRPSKPPTLRTELVSVFAQSRLSLSESVTFLLGARHDDSSSYGSVNTPRFGLVLRHREFTVKTLYGKAFRAPKPWDYTDGVGNPNLRPEDMRSLELAGAWSASAHLRAELCLYRNRLDDILTRVFAGEKWRWMNAGEVRTAGLEGVIEYRRAPVRALVGYSFNDSQGEDGRQVAEIARHAATLSASYRLSRQFTADLRLRYTGRRTNPKPIPTTGTDTIEAALVMDAAILWGFPGGFFLQGVITNLTDTEYYHPSNLPPSRYRQPQRALRLKAGYAF